MKRKLFNAALFAAVLVAAPVGTFVSCADYDSDIENLNGQINDLEQTVLQKEKALQEKIAALEAQDKAIEEAYKAADEALKQSINEVDVKLSKEIAECKAECAAAREQLQKQINDLKADLASLQEKHDKDIKELLEADQVLRNDLAKANAAIETLEGRFDKLSADFDEYVKSNNTEIANLKAELEKVNTEIKKVNEEIAKVRTEFAAADKALEDKFQGEVDKLWAQVNANKAAIETEVDARKAAIEELKKVVDENKAAFDAAYKELKDKDAELAGLIQTLRNDFEAYKELNDAAVEALGERMTTVEGQVSTNTAAILSLAGRVADLYLGLDNLQNALDAAIAAQKVVDAAQDERLLLLEGQVVELAESLEGAWGAIGDIESELMELRPIIKEMRVTINRHEIAINQLTSDLTALTQRVLANEQAISALTNRVGKNEQDIASLKKTVSQINEEIANIKGDIEVINGKIDGINEEIAGMKKQINSVKTELWDLTQNVNSNVDRLDERIDKVIEAFEWADNELYQNIQMEMGELKDALTQLIENTAKELSAEVKGFVLLPDNYYEGIQAIEGDVYKYKTWTIGTDGYATLNKDKVEYCPEVVANYHVNPSTAVLSTDVQYYNYNVEDRINRGNNNALVPVIKSVEQVKTVKAGQDKDNMLTVHMSITDPTANKTYEEHYDYNTPVTVMALQYNNPAAKAENPVVTSDYAVLYLQSLNGVNLLDERGKDVPDLHTHKNFCMFGDVLPAKDVYVNYKETWTIEDHIKTQFGTKDASATLPEGFVYQYSFVEGDSKYFNADQLTAGVVDPQLYNGNEATVACIGKHIIVRVDVVNTNRDNEVAEVGFFNFWIVGDAVVDFADETIANEDYNISCEPTAVALSTELSAENVWNKIMEVTGLTADEVKAEYSYVFVSGSETVLQQYTKSRETLNYGGVGTVELTEEGNLLWTITYADLDGSVPPLSTAILVRSTDLFNGNGTYNEFYLPLTWEPAHTEVWGEATNGVEPVDWTYNKVSNQWQTLNGKDEIRLYADLTKSGTTPFTYNIPAKAMTGEMTTALVNYDNFKNAADFALTDGRFIFVEHPDEAARTAVGVSGMTYTLTVSGTGNQLNATDENGVKKAVASITNEGVVSLENNEFTKDMLNKYEKNELGYGQTLAAHVSYEVKCCAGAVEVVSGDFDVRFIKPVTVKTDAINITDADGEAGVVTVDFTKNIVAFNGYTFAQHPEYFDIFALNVTIAEPANWHTDYNGANIDEETLDKYPSIAEAFAVDENESGNHFVTYVNNTSVINEFTVRVPVTVTYVWGDEVTYDIDIKVLRTNANSNKRK